MNTKYQAILIPYAFHIKRLFNLSNLNPSSCILSNATKLTNVEIHSSELYNINVTNNKYLRRVDLENCVALGTVTATGSSLNLSNCKYLRYCNVYNTALTEVQLNTSGGSLTEIYYPKTIQSIQLIKQRLLEVVGIPYSYKTILPNDDWTIGKTFSASSSSSSWTEKDGDNLSDYAYGGAYDKFIPFNYNKNIKVKRVKCFESEIYYNVIFGIVLYDESKTVIKRFTCRKYVTASNDLYEVTLDTSSYTTAKYFKISLAYTERVNQSGIYPYTNA